jgi:hypothetical protein
MFRSYDDLHVNFRCTSIYFRLKMAVRPKHVADNLNKIVNNYRNRVVDYVDYEGSLVFSSVQN